MSPHAVDLNDRLHLSQSNSSSSSSSPSNGNGNGYASGYNVSESLLQRHDSDEVHDLVCVGFGPASLAIAVALNDALETGDPVLNTDTPKVRFLERQQAFAWHAGMLLPGAKMQITFIKDLATMRNPRSPFTFLNYLHENGRLAAFTNLGTFLPQRIEYEQYMRWAADHFHEVVDYNMDVLSVDVGSRSPHDGRIESFVVTSADKSTRRSSSIRAKHVVIAPGGKPRIPKSLPINHPRILHSSRYATEASSVFANGAQPRSIAVIGGGQSAAEIFHNIPSRFPGAKAHLLIRGDALRPSDDSPFVNEIFDPERVDDFYGRDINLREKSLAQDKATNYGVVRLELLDELYAQLYSQRIQIPNEEDRPLHILNHREVTAAKDITENGQQRLRLHIQNDTNKFSATANGTVQETLDVDLVIVASGYIRDAHNEMLKDLKAYMPGAAGADKPCIVNRDYSVRFNDDALSRDTGIWLQGCNEMTHGLSDTLLSILATRGGEMVDSIFGAKQGLAAAKLNGLNDCNVEV